MKLNYWLMICLMVRESHLGNGYQSITTLSDLGLEFSSIDFSVMFLLETIAQSLMSCIQMCHSTTECRIFDYDDQTQRCRLFEGNVTTMGSLISSSSSRSRVGSIDVRPEDFSNQGQPCSYCEQSRELTCMNGTCQCRQHTFFDGPICQSQKLNGFNCSAKYECRLDLNYTCLSRRQCGPASLEIGATMIGYANGIGGSTLDALNLPLGLSMDSLGSLYVSDRENQRVVKIEEGAVIGAMVAGTGIPGRNATQLYQPSGLHIDGGFNIYVVDRINDRVMLWKNNSSYGIRVAGNGTTGSDLSTLSWANGIAVDSMGNVFVSECWNHRVTKWTINATYGVIVAGGIGAGSTSSHLFKPFGIYLDDINSYLYIADSYNNRIQRIDLNGTTNGITVAGGNGQGTNNNQLDNPTGVYVSKITGDIYIADFNNHRIQLWKSGATSGLTIAGTTGITGASSTLFNGPWDLILDNNETYLYVSDTNNNRVQRFKLF